MLQLPGDGRFGKAGLGVLESMELDPLPSVVDLPSIH